MGGTNPPSISNDVLCSAHARQRQDQRNISDKQLSYVLRHGKRLRRTGVEFILLRRCDIPTSDLSDDHCARLEGTVVVLGEDRTVVTVYRNRTSLRNIQKKLKHRHPRRQERHSWKEV